MKNYYLKIQKKIFLDLTLNKKKKRKQYDGFLFQGDIISSKPKLINTKPIFYLNKKESDIFITQIKKKFDKVKIKLINKKIPIFLSDHFGVECNLKILN